MATITKSIGTNGRDYSTITLWEADLNGAAGGSGNDAVGECYADSTFGEGVDFDDGTPDSVLLTVPENERHDGTASGGGVVVDYSSTIFVFNAPTDVTLEWLRITGFTTPESNVYAINSLYRVSGTFKVQNCVIHDGGNYGIRLYGANNREAYNNVVYGITRPGTYAAYAIYMDWTQSMIAANNTVYNCTNTGIRCDTTSHTVVNDISVGCGSADYSSATTHVDSDYNIDSDGTAPGSNSLTSSAGNLFVSTVGGSEDLHLKAGADAIGAAADWGSDIAIDIDGDDRTGETWDIGADQRVVAATGNPWWYYRMSAN